MFYSDIIHTQSSLSGYRKAQFTPVGAAILTIALVSLSVMALSTSEVLANNDSQGVSWTEVETQDLLGATGKVYTSSLHLADLAVGDPIPRIQCPPGYTATLYVQGLSSPDGLAFSPSGLLHVAEETAGRVSRIESGGSITTTVVSGLTNPEGIAFDTDGNLYVVEDVQNGRLVQVEPGGGTTALATGLDAPEGVVWASDGTTYITESNVEFNPSNLQTRVTAVVSPSVTVLTTDTLLSYAGITWGVDGLLYVTNELSGLWVGIDDSVFTVDPTTGTRTLFATDLRAPEGLRFAANGDFPLYVAEEDTGGGAGRLSQIEADGSHTPFCTGFGSIEDVAVDDSGRLYVSEDRTGFIIVIEYKGLPINLAIGKTVTPTTDVTYHGTVTYTVVLSNSGAGHGTGVLLTDTLPSQVDFARWVVQPASADETNDQITWNGTVTASTAITFTFVVTHTGDYGDVVTNTAEYSHTTGSGSDEATFTVESTVPVYLPIILKGVQL